MRDITRSAKGDFKRLTTSGLIVIDDIMLFPVEKMSPWFFLTLSIKSMEQHH